MISQNQNLHWLIDNLDNYQRYIQSLIPNAVDGIDEEWDKIGKCTVKPLV